MNIKYRLFSECPLILICILCSPSYLMHHFILVTFCLDVLYLSVSLLIHFFTPVISFSSL